MKKSPLFKLWQKYQEVDFGIIAAARSNFDHQENAQRALQLKTDLIKLHHSVTTVTGFFIENYGQENATQVHENLFLVFDRRGKGALKEDLIKLGKKYDQDFVTYNSTREGNYYLIDIKRSDDPNLKAELKLESPKFEEKGEFCLKVEGSPFVIEGLSQDACAYDYDITKYNISTIMCLKKMDDFVLSE